MIKINLLPKETLDKEKGKKLAVLIALACIGLISAVIGIYSMRVLKYSNLKASLRDVENRLRPLQKIIEQVDIIENEKIKLNTKIGVIKTLMKESLVYPHLMEDLSLLIPKNVWMITLNTRSKEGKLQLKIKLSATNNHGVAAFTAILENSERFDNVEMGAVSSAKSKKGIEIRNFEINCEYIIVKGIGY